MIVSVPEQLSITPMRRDVVHMLTGDRAALGGAAAVRGSGCLGRAITAAGEVSQEAARIDLPAVGVAAFPGTPAPPILHAGTGPAAVASGAPPAGDAAA